MVSEEMTDSVAGDIDILSPPRNIESKRKHAPVVIIDPVESSEDDDMYLRNNRRKLASKRSRVEVVDLAASSEDYEDDPLRPRNSEPTCKRPRLVIDESSESEEYDSTMSLPSIRSKHLTLDLVTDRAFHLDAKPSDTTTIVFTSIKCPRDRLLETLVKFHDHVQLLPSYTEFKLPAQNPTDWAHRYGITAHECRMHVWLKNFRDIPNMCTLFGICRTRKYIGGRSKDLYDEEEGHYDQVKSVQKKRNEKRLFLHLSSSSKSTIHDYHSSRTTSYHCHSTTEPTGQKTASPAWSPNSCSRLSSDSS